MAREPRNINLILQEDLCIGCGICVTCPEEAIALIYHDHEGYKPVLAGEKCVDCGLCMSLCPSYGVFPDQSGVRTSSKRADGLIGRYLNTYSGYSCDNRIRYESASGGMATTLLLTALEKGIIDGAILTRMSREDPLRAEVCLAMNREEILSCKGSVYNISAVGVGLNQVLGREGKFAVVGLPCHILAYRKALDQVRGAAEKIVLCVGLLCSHTVYPRATRLLLRSEGIALDKVRQISYRGRGWPGSMSVRLEGGDEVLLPSEKYSVTFFFTHFFTPLRCLLCNDATAELADISVGDAWLADVKKKDNQGTSLVISRSQRAEELLGEAVATGKIYLERLPPARVIQSQKGSINFKKRGIRARMRIIGRLIRKVDLLGSLPNAVGRPNLISHIVTVLVLMSYVISKRERADALLLRVPEVILRVYGKGIEFLKAIG